VSERTSVTSTGAMRTKPEPGLRALQATPHQRPTIPCCTECGSAAAPPPLASASALLLLNAGNGAQRLFGPHARVSRSAMLSVVDDASVRSCSDGEKVVAFVKAPLCRKMRGGSGLLVTVNELLHEHSAARPCLTLDQRAVPLQQLQVPLTAGRTGLTCRHPVPLWRSGGLRRSARRGGVGVTEGAVPRNAVRAHVCAAPSRVAGASA
jgi:hypothetical protein